MKKFLRQPNDGRSGYITLGFFFLAYTATMALVVAPDLVKSLIDAALIWPF